MTRYHVTFDSPEIPPHLRGPLGFAKVGVSVHVEASSAGEALAMVLASPPAPFRQVEVVWRPELDAALEANAGSMDVETRWHLVGGTVMDRRRTVFRVAEAG